MLARVPKRCEQGTGRMLLPAAQCAACRVAVRGCYELASCLTRACAHQISPGERDGDPSLTAFPKSQRAAALRWSSVSTKKQKKEAQYCMLVQSLLASKLLYGGRIRRPPESDLEEVRHRCARGLEAILHLGALGGGGLRAGDQDYVVAADVELLLAPVEAMGGGVPDLRGELAAETAVDLLTMLASRAPAGRAAAAAAGGSNELEATK
eukprot:scaffold51922_cov32-Phaeocystis_antarctica.AAC.1